METLSFSPPPCGFLSKGLFSWRASVTYPPFFSLVILAALLLIGESRALADVTIAVDAAQNQGEINPRVFGQNVFFDANTMWDHRTDTLRAEPDNSGVNVKSRIEDLAPTILRFPGGRASDVYIWEDGLGLQVNNQPFPGQTEIILNESPQSWGLGPAGRGLLIDPAPIPPFTTNLMGQLGDWFNFTGINGSKLTGVSDIHASHSSEARVRPGGRPNPDPDVTSYYWTNTYGIIEHMKLVKSLGAQALLTVNYGTGLDSTGMITTNASLSQRIMRAQALVAFCNGIVGDTRPLGMDGGSNRDENDYNWGTVGDWAGKRAALGYPDPFGVIYWEVGNELFFNTEPGHTTASDYTDKFKQFAQQMRDYIDPQIKVGAVGHNLPTYHGDDDPGNVPWNETVITNTINDIDFLVIHTYYPTIQSPIDYNSDSWFKLVMAGATQAGEHLSAIKGIIDSKNVNHRNIGLAVTEYGFWCPGGNATNNSSLAKALHDADLLMYLIKKEGSTEKLGLLAAAAWDLHSGNMGAAIGYQWPGINNPLTYTDSGLRTIRPQYYALKMPRENLAGRQLVQTSFPSPVPTFAVNAGGNIEAHSAIPCLEALGALSNNGRRLTLAVINRSVDNNSTISANIQLNNLPFTPKSATVTKLSSTNLGDNNETSESVKPTGPVTYAPVPQSFAFEPHSLTIIEFRSLNFCPIINLLMLDV